MWRNPLLRARLGRGAAVLSAVAVVPLTALAGMSSATAAPTAATPWVRMLTPKPIGSNSTDLKSVSCPADAGKFCVAVGYETFLPSNLSAPLVEMWRGGGWKVMSVVSPAKGDTFNSVSCGLPNYCMAVGNGGFAELWNGSKWTVTATSFGESFTYPRISCSSTDCLAISDNNFFGGVPAASFWNGQSWTDVTPPGLTTAYNLWDVSCSSPGQCVVVGDLSHQPIFYEYSGGTWTVGPSNPGGSDVRSVSCQTVSAPATCMAAGYTGPGGNEVPYAAIWNSSTASWTTVATPIKQAIVDCPSATTCVGVGGQSLPNRDAFGAYAELWNGPTWTTMNTNNINNASVKDLEWEAVSCPTPTFCVVVGEQNPGTGPAPTAASWGTAP